MIWNVNPLLQFFPSAWDLLKFYSEEELVYPHCILNLQELGRCRDR